MRSNAQRLAVLGIFVLWLAMSSGAAVAAEERLVFSIPPDEASTPDLVSLDVRTGDLRNLTSSPEWHEYAPAASWDGATVLFGRNRSECWDWTGTARCPGDLWLIGADGAGLTRVTDTPRFDEIEGALSPDGTRVVYSGTAHGTDSIGLYVATVRGANVRRLAVPHDIPWDPDWSPDGKQIAFTRYVPGFGTSSIWVMNADGTAPRQVTHPPSSSSVDDAPAWSPDGRQIAFMRLGPDGRYETWAVASDGTDERQITVDPRYNSFVPTWSPDGSRLAVSRFPGIYIARSWYAMEPSPLYPTLFVDTGINVVNADGSDPGVVYETRFNGWDWTEPAWTLVAPGSALPAALPLMSPEGAHPPSAAGKVAIVAGPLQLSRSGIARVVLRCLGGPCRGRLELRAGARRIGSSTYLLLPGRPRAVGIRISARGRRLARRRGGVRVRAVTVDEHARSVSRRAVLRASRARRR